MTYRLSAQRVEQLLGECMAEPGERETTRVVPGITGSFAVDLTKINKAKPEIANMLLQLSDAFMTGKGMGGGYSFLQACEDRQGRQWADFHRSMEALFVLGMGADLADCLAPRELWSALPGGMPYYSVRQDSCRQNARLLQAA